MRILATDLDRTLLPNGRWEADIPAHPNGTVIEFYVHAEDTGGLTRTWPAPTWDTVSSPACSNRTARCCRSPAAK